MPTLHVIMPVKDSMHTARPAIHALMQCPDIELTVYNDFSQPATTDELTAMAATEGFHLHNWADHTDHPSPNYRLTLQHAQRSALEAGTHLAVVESDVIVQPDTLQHLQAQVRPHVAMVAAITVDAQGEVNFPYRYARHMKDDVVNTRKRFSFCCTLMTNEWLQAYDFAQLDPTKQWYDVTLSHLATAMGFTNLLLPSVRVLHTPHSSRPWKQLKYTHPLRYYWQKITQHRDRI